MEKKNNKKNTKTTTKSTDKKVLRNKKTNKKKVKGFTLIELLAVIIILGVLMIIAIPAVTSYISNSRKSSYVTSAKEIIGGARTLVNSGRLGMYDTSVTYYIPVSMIPSENGTRSPYGDFTQAYIGVIYDGQGYKYYWISNDTAREGIPEVTAMDKLDNDSIKSDVNDIDIRETVETTGVEGRCTIMILKEDGTWEEPRITGNCNSSGGESSSNAVVYPTGKTKDTVVVGDIVTIDTEEFYVVKRDGSDLILLSHYNLNVGSNKKAGATEGIQDSEVKGWVSSGTKYGNIAFSSMNYWAWKVGTDYPENYCSSNTYTSGTNCTYVYDANSNLKTYVDSYKTYLEGKGATIKSARLLRVEEAFELGCGQGQWSCSTSPANAPSWVYETSYWLGSAYGTSDVWIVYSSGVFSYDPYYFVSRFGVRPVIII